jgi:bifunctional DNase/RNase
VAAHAAAFDSDRQASPGSIVARYRRHPVQSEGVPCSRGPLGSALRCQRGIRSERVHVLIELEVAEVWARPTSDEERQRQTEELEQAFAEQRGGEPGAVVVDVPTLHHRVRLKERTGDRVLEFGIGQSEAMAIASVLHGDLMPRPMTHDLIGNLLRALDDVSVLRVIITRRERGTFYAELELRHRESEMSLDCRPSDGIAVAVRLGVPIMAADGLEPVLAVA